MCDIAEGQNDITQTRHPRARVEHMCQGCPEPIRPGDVYAVTRVLYDGYWSGWKYCLRCEAMYKHLLEKAWHAHDHLAIEPGLDCDDKYEKAWGEPPPADIAALAFALPGDFPMSAEAPT